MKKRLKAVLLLAVLFALVWAVVVYNASRRSVWNRLKTPETVQMLKRFVVLKEAQAGAVSNALPSEIQTIFKYAERGDWLALSNAVRELQDRNNEYWNASGYGTWHRKTFRLKMEGIISDMFKKLGSPLPWDYWAPPSLNWTPGEAVREVHGVFNAFLTGDEKYSSQFGREIIGSIPPGSIYFGGTDPGRYIVTAMSRSQPRGDPFFTLMQISLAGGPYLEYLRSMYGNTIYIPTDLDSQKAFDEYRAMATMNLNGAGVINGMLAKVVFEQNSNRDFYVEQGSYAQEWMQPRLEPHGLIFKLNRQPLAELSEEIVQRDRDYWSKLLEPKIGGWLTNETSVETVAKFVKKTFTQHDYAGFVGDLQFVQNDYACKMFSKERSSIAGLYAWRAEHATNTLEKTRMTVAADFAFRQAWALCPYSPEAVYCYVNVLLPQNRFDDAVRVAEAFAALPQNKDNEQAAHLLTQLKQMQTEHPPKPGN